MFQYKEFQEFSVVKSGALTCLDLGPSPRVIPVVMIDTSISKEIQDFFKIPPNQLIDVKTRWYGEVSLINKDNSIRLLLEYTEPFKIKFGIIFNYEKWSPALLGIIYNRAFYLCQGNESSDVLKAMDNNSAIISVPDMDVDDKIIKDVKKMIYNNKLQQGFDKQKAKEISEEFIGYINKNWEL